MALTSNLEIYMARAIRLALESDIGVLFGASKQIDGVALLKHGEAKKLEFEQYIIECTKGDWPSRVAAYQRIFGEVPEVVTANLSALEAIRKLRNKVGHAFGRDIDEARKHGLNTTIPMESLSRVRTIRYHAVVWEVAKSIDRHLMEAHIGEYQVAFFYHQLYPSLRKDIHPSDRAMILKREIGRLKAVPIGKEFCKGVVRYYEAL
jgi:hypothetical protein